MANDRFLESDHKVSSHKWVVTLCKVGTLGCKPISLHISGNKCIMQLWPWLIHLRAGKSIFWRGVMWCTWLLWHIITFTCWSKARWSGKLGKVRWIILTWFSLMSKDLLFIDKLLGELATRNTLTLGVVQKYNSHFYITQTDKKLYVYSCVPGVLWPQGYSCTIIQFLN